MSLERSRFLRPTGATEVASFIVPPDRAIGDVVWAHSNVGLGGGRIDSQRSAASQAVLAIGCVGLVIGGFFGIATGMFVPFALQYVGVLGDDIETEQRVGVAIGFFLGWALVAAWQLRKFEREATPWMLFVGTGGIEHVSWAKEGPRRAAIPLDRIATGQLESVRVSVNGVYLRTEHKLSLSDGSGREIFRQEVAYKADPLLPPPNDVLCLQQLARELRARGADVRDVWGEPV